MTTTDDLVHSLSPQAKITLLQIWHDPALQSAVIPPALATLLTQGLVNMIDGKPAISRRGQAVALALDSERRISTYERFLSIVSKVLTCAGDLPGIEQAFAGFTEPELDHLAAAVEQLGAAINQART